ncbi:MAG: ribosome biogenesis GTP-binding protein YihA/YsxC [Xanthomonadales bacterium]|nr:ribosome biogenesis GTP-binding protein YihA/YsxC [Xanthomonadales bacterium]
MAEAPLDFSSAQFTIAAQQLRQMPPDEGREVAFAGRSNAGKSSALNAISNRRALARVSKTPGRTQQLVVFELTGTLRLVDLPGYGYAKVPAELQESWRRTMEAYFQKRRALAGLILVMDIRHPLRPFDWQMLDFCAFRKLPVHVLLTKADKLKRGRAIQTEREVVQALEDAQLPTSVQRFSATSGEGVEQAREVITSWLLARPA